MCNLCGLHDSNLLLSSQHRYDQILRGIMLTMDLLVRGRVEPVLGVRSWTGGRVFCPKGCHVGSGG